MKPNKRRLIALLAGAASLLISCGNQSSGDVIRIGLECAYVPFNWVAEESEYTLPIANHAGSFADGYDIQIAKKISSELSKKVEIVQTKWESLITDRQMGAIDAIVAGEMNATIECTPLYGPFVEQTIEALENGEEMSKEVIHPEEGVYDMDGGIDVGGVVSVKAADVIDERVY